MALRKNVASQVLTFNLVNATSGAALTGASVTAATAAPSHKRLKLTDPRIWPWIVVGLGMGHAQAMVGQAMGFLVIDRLAIDPLQAQQAVGLVLMTGAGAALLVQWGMIPLLNMTPRMMVIVGLALAAAGCLVISASNSLYAMATAFGLASAGFGFARPGYTAGSSLAVGQDLQAAVAGRITSVNGASFIIGPSIGVGLYEVWRPATFLTSAVMCLILLGYSLAKLSRK